MRIFSRSVALTLVALLISVVVFGYGSQASGPQVELPTVVATVAVGTGDANGGPEGVGVDTVTNRIFVANSKDNAIYVVNGTANTVAATITDARINGPQGVAANPVSRKVYVANSGRRSLLVINADTMSIVKEITGLGPGPTSVAIDSSANLVYVTNFVDYEIGQSVSVINGATDTLSATVGLEYQYPYGIALDVAQHRAYVTHRWADTARYVTVIDTVGLGVSSYGDYPMSEITGIAVRPSASSVFVAQRYNSQNNPSLAIFDYTGGAFHKLRPWNTGLPLTLDGATYYGKPIGVAYNPTTDRVFVNSYNQNAVVVVDAVNLSVLTALGVGANPDLGIAVNPVTSMVYVANRSSGTLSVIQDGAVGPTPTPTSTPTPTPLPCMADAYEPDNTPAQARAIIPTFGYTQSHSFCGTAAPWYDQEDWVRFSVNSAVVLTMTTSALTNGADTYLQLYGPNVATNDTYLEGDENSGGGLASKIVYTITQPGMYFLRVYNQDAVPVPPVPQWNYDLAVIGGPPLSNRVFLPLIIRE